jgi:hypothetical protein
MTLAPAPLLDARRLLIDHLHIDPLSVGVVGDTAHAEGGDSYHLGADKLRERLGHDRYSVDESPRDRRPTDAAAALDVGDFAVTVAGKLHTLPTFSIWLVAQCKAGTADTADIREVIYSPDSKTVKRWDRLGRRTSGDGSHLFHTHISYFRDSESRDKAGLFRRYLTYIGLLEDGVSQADVIAALKSPEGQQAIGLAVKAQKIPIVGTTVQREIGTVLSWIDQNFTGVNKAIVALAAKDQVDEAALAAALMPLLSGDQLEAVIRAGMTPEKRLALAARLAS